ncbi:ATP-binding protein [Massilia sp. W12]|uniref:ATP-binding protein n=1 Tax=Massilia sp. W12 TaxID=3126507 RepID=UPI0030CABA75
MRTQAEILHLAPDIVLLDEGISRLEQTLLREAGCARLPAMLQLAWGLRQRDTRRALDLADEAEMLLPHSPWQASLHTHGKMRLLLLRAEAFWLYANMDAAQALLEQCQQLLTQHHEAAIYCDALILQSRMSADRGDTAQEDAMLKAAAACAPDPWRALVVQGLASYAALLHDARSALAHWGPQISEPGPEAHPLEVLTHCDFLAASAWMHGDFGRSAMLHMRAHQAALQCGMLRRALFIAGNIGDSFCCLNDHHAALQWMQHGLEMARRSNWPLCIGVCLTQTAQVMRHLGRRDSAARMLDEAMHVLQPFTGSRNQSITLEYLADLALENGEYQVALEHFHQLYEQAAALEQADFFASAWRGQAHALCELGDGPGALAAAQTALELARRQHDGARQIEVLQVLAHIHHQHPDLPHPAQWEHASPPAQTPAQDPELYLLEQAIAIGKAIQGYTIAGDLLDQAANAYARLGDYAQAYQLAREANLAREKTHSQQATNRAIALQIRQHTEQTQAEGEYHRQLAQAEAQRALSLQQMTATLAHLSQIGQEITAHRERHSVFTALNRHVHQMLDVSSFAIYLLHEDGLWLERAFGIEAGCALPAGRIACNNPHALSARALREQSEILDDRNPEDEDSVIPGTRASLCALFAPLCAAGQALGVMTVQSLQRHAYGERERLIFRSLCAYGAIALANANAYDQLQHTHTRLAAQEKLGSLGGLVAGVAHELNTPLGNALIMSSALLQRNGQIQDLLDRQQLRLSELQLWVEEADEGAAVILRGLRQAAQLVGSFKQVALDRTTEQLRDFELQQTLHEILATVMNRLRPDGHELLLEIDAGIMLHSYPGPLGQVITHLIDNALRHGFDGRRNGRMRLCAQQSGRRVRLSFEDNGAGIAPPHLKQVFDPFFTTRMGQGCTGLGLSICHNIVHQLLGGAIGIVSQQGKGVIVTLDLPLCAPGAQQGAAGHGQD